MKLDWHLIRKVLLAAEIQPRAGLPKIEGHDPDEVGYHAHLLNEMGLAKGYTSRNAGHLTEFDSISSLTAAGHELVELIGDESRWNAVLAEAQRRGAATLAVLSNLLRSTGSINPRGRAEGGSVQFPASGAHSGLPSWDFLRDEFLRYAGQYPNLSGEWFSRASEWRMWDRSASDREAKGSELFCALADIAGGKLSDPDLRKDTELWHVWLERLSKKDRFREDGDFGILKWPSSAV